MATRRNYHKEIIDPAIHYLTGRGAVCQSYHSPRSMPQALVGHPDLVVHWTGIMWYVEIKPSASKKHPPLSNSQCRWFWKFYPIFSYNTRYVIAQTYDGVLTRVDPDNRFDISVPEYYFKKLQEWKELSDG